MKEYSKKATFICTPYLFWLLIIGNVGYTAAMLWGVHLTHDYTDLCIKYVFHICILIYYGFLFFNRFQWLSVVDIYEDRLTLRAMFTKRDYYYADMEYIGIDYGLIEGTPQIWIYFSQEPVPMKYYHKITSYPIRKRFLRVLYTKEHYELLIRHTPPDISRQLRKCNSTIMAYKGNAK